MKRALGLVVLAALGGCAVDQPGRAAYSQPRDPAQWRVVSVTPVPAGTAARVAAKSSDGKPVEYTTGPAPVTHAYRPAPVYGTAPPVVYGPYEYYPSAPVYRTEPGYYWPPVTSSLGFVFGRHWSRGHHGGHHGGRHRRHR